MVDFIYHTTDPDDQVCRWIDELYREWGGSCFISKNDKTKLWVRPDGGKRVRVKDFGNNLSEFKKRVKKALG